MLTNSGRKFAAHRAFCLFLIAARAKSQGMPKSVIVIGAGIGGLAAAVLLAQAGIDVTIVESNSQVGGTAQDHQTRGFSWSLAPPLLSARPQLDSLIRDLGRSPNEYLRWMPMIRRRASFSRWRRL